MYLKFCKIVILGLTQIAQDLNAGSAPAIGVDQHSNFKNRQVDKKIKQHQQRNILISSFGNK